MNQSSTPLQNFPDCLQNRNPTFLFGEKGIQTSNSVHLSERQLGFEVWREGEIRGVKRDGNIACLRCGKVVDEDPSAFGECEKSVLVDGDVAVFGATGEFILHHAAHDSPGQLLRLCHSPLFFDFELGLKLGLGLEQGLFQSFLAMFMFIFPPLSSLFLPLSSLFFVNVIISAVFFCQRVTICIGHGPGPKKTNTREQCQRANTAYGSINKCLTKKKALKNVVDKEKSINKCSGDQEEKH